MANFIKISKPKLTTDQLITRITGWISGIIVLGLAIWGISSLWTLNHYEFTDDAQVQEYVNPVISRAGGFITNVRFEENQNVKKGDTLITIDQREYVYQAAQTQAAIHKAEAELKVLQSQILTAKKNAEVAKTQIAASNAKIWKQQLDYDRYQKLVLDEAATEQRLEDIKATLDVYKSENASAQENYIAATSKVNDIEAQRAVINAEIERLSALLGRNNLDVDYTVIVAPYNGRMGKRAIEPGQMINVGEVLAYIVNDETDKWVVANFKETQVAKMKIGNKAKIKVDAYPDKEFQGTIISLSPATGSSFSLLPPDNATGNYVKIVQRIPVRIRVDGERKDIDMLKVGMNANVYVLKNQSDSK